MGRRMRASISAALWAALGALGLSKSRWLGTPPMTRRVVKAVLWVAIGLLMIVFFGVWKSSALAIAAVILVLVVPAWNRLSVRGKRIGKWIVPTAALGIAVAYPFYLSAMPQFPIFGPAPQMSTMVGMAVFSMMALGLNFVVGYAGLLDLGYVAFYAMGSYMAGWFASSQFAKQNIRFGAVGVGPGLTGFHFSIWLVLLMAGIATAVIGVLIGLPTLRLRGDYLAIVTLGFGEIMPQILTLGSNAGRAFFWTALVLMLLTIFCSSRLRDSRLGRAWIAIREDETAAAAMGVPLMRTKTWAYATGAFFGGVAGAYYASYNGGAYADEFFFNISVFILCMVILGGMGNIWGVIFGACFLEYLDREGLANIGAWLNGHFGPGGSDIQIWNKVLDVPLYEFGIFGTILVVVMLFRPEGLIPSSRRAAEFHEGVHDEPLYDIEAA